MSVDNLADRNEAARLYEEYLRLFDADEPSEDAWNAYEVATDKSGVNLLTEENSGALMRCAITGVPLDDKDEIVTVLKSAIEKVPA